MNCEELQQMSIGGNLSVSGISVNTVEEIRLLIIVRGKDDIVNDALENLFVG
jgi:hypothetical protein